MSDDDHDRIDELEGEIEELRQTVEAKRKHIIKPRLEELDAESDDARDERAELRATIEDLKTKVANFQFELEALKGLGENEQTSPAARVRDLRADMIDEAKTLSNRKGVQLWWKEVQSIFARLGHGEVKAPECHKAMEDAAVADGFDLTKKVNENGNRVKAIRLKTDALPAGGVVSNSTNAKGVGPRQNGGESAAQSNQD